MDCGSIYIKMCKKAEEIQAIWHAMREEYQPRPGSKSYFGLHYRKGYEGSFYAGQGGELIGCVDYEYDTRYEPSHIWLPRQDELQEMVRIPKYSGSTERLFLLTLCESYKAFLEGGARCYNNGYLNYESLEQLWLAFVMSRRYGKVWDGENWIKRGIK